MADIPTDNDTQAQGCGAASHQDSGAFSDQIHAELAPICAIVQRHTGHDFFQYKPATLCRRIRRRMQLLREVSVRDYVELLEHDAAEAHSLLAELVVSVSEFFRNPEAFATLEAQVLPPLCQADRGDLPLRVWVPGCASGEETYSLAILLDEYLRRNGSARTVQIFATDIDGEALREARQGRYTEAAIGAISEERRGRYFAAESGGYRVVPALREMCSFAIQDLIRDPPFSSLDLISCRNVLIYLQPQAQNRVIELFHYALRSSGYLFLGPSEGLLGALDLFDTVDKNHRIFRRKEVAPRPPVRVASFARHGQGHVAQAAGGAPPKSNPLDAVSQAFARMLVEEYAPASVVVNERGDIHFMAGHVGRFFSAGFSAPSQNLLDQTDGELRRELRACLGRAVSQRSRVHRRGVRVQTSEGRRLVRLAVRPLPNAAHEARLFVVVLQEDGGSELGDEPENEVLGDSELVGELERELHDTRAELQTTVEELESSNEELKSSNEELQSANEELQSSQEELRSVNEELEEVNSKLEEKVKELHATNDDLANLIANTQIAILFLDASLRITRFTPTAAVVFHLQERDVGRSIAELSSRFVDADLFEDARCALTGIGAIERDTRSADGIASYIVRFSAYQGRSEGKAGVVITFSDVTAIRGVQSEVARLASFPERDPNPIVELDRAMKVSYVNAAAAALFPGLATQGARHPWLRGIEENAAHLEQGLDRSRTDELVLDGRSYQRTTHFLPDLGRVRVYGQDVSARANAERELQRERDFLDQVMATSPVGIVAMNGDGQLTHANPRALAILGLTEPEAVNRAFNAPDWRITDFDGRSVPDEELPFAIVTRSKRPVYDVRHAIVRPDGTRILLSVNAAPIIGGNGGLEGIVAALEDVSAAFRANRALRESEQKYRDLFENLTVGFGLHEMIYDGEGRPTDYRFLELNPAFERLTGLPRSHAIGKTVREVMPNIEQYWIDAYAGVVETGQPLSYENYAEELGKHFEVVAFRAAPGRFATLFSDVTTRKKADAILLRTQKLDSVAVLAGGIAHDFNNLLSGLFGFMELAEASSPPGSEARAHLAEARSVFQRSRALAQQLLTFAKGGTPLKQVEDLRPLLRDAVSFALSGANVEADFDIAEDLWPSEVDKNQIAQVVDNLVLNARQAMPEGGRIEIQARNVAPHEVEIVIRDHGPGIPAEALTKIFDPFYTTRSQGTGLGLTSTHSIVRNHGGRIEVASEVGNGSAFSIHLPATMSQAPAAERASVAPHEARRARILVMDDEESILRMLGAMITRMGHDVSCARHGQEAIERFREAIEQGQPFDLVILDLTVRGAMGGREAIDAIRKLDPKAKAIVSSGYAEDPALASPTKYGFCGRLLKPSSIRDLREVVDSCLARTEDGG